MATESSISPGSASGVPNFVNSGVQRVNRSLEALCNVAGSALRTIRQPTSSSVLLAVKPDTAQPVFTTHTVVPLVGNLPWNIYEGVTPKSETNVAQIMPFVQYAQCYVPSSSSGFLQPVCDLLTSRPMSMSVASSASTPQLILTQSVAIETQHHPIERSLPPSSSSALQRLRKTARETATSAGRHVCKVCSRACAKPSVLQKHMRTHTGERPYPCRSCGLQFKTKSNLYKHCKSRTHQHCLLTKAGVGTLDKSVNSPTTAVAATDVSSSGAVSSLIGEQSRTDEFCCPPASGLTASDIRNKSYVTQQGALSVPGDEQDVRCMSGVGIGSVNVSGQPVETETNSCSRTTSPTASMHSRCELQKPSDLLNDGSEPPQDRISRLIIQNASIINNTPLAEAPRQKRILRQSSDVVGNPTAKSVFSKPLLRAKSLNPPEKVSAKELEIQTMPSSHKKLTDKSDCAPRLPISNSFVSVKVPSEMISKSQYLTVPGETALFEYGMRHNKADFDVETLPEVLSGNIRIVLQLCDSTPEPMSSFSSELSSVINAPVASSPTVVSSPLVCSPTQPVRISVSSLPAFPSPSISSTVSASVCLVRPVVDNLSQSWLSQSDSLTALKYVVVSDTSSSGVITARQSPVSAVVKTAVTFTESSPKASDTVNLSNLPPRRGRPKGSKNRPKLATSASDPQAFPASAPAAPPSPLWKAKLKDQLLMRRSLSTEKAYSAEKAVSFEKLVNVISTGSNIDLTPLSQPPALVESLLTVPILGDGMSAFISSDTCVITDASGHIAAVPVTRSLSCDASVPPKKRKALTELGRGTAFGTRVEDTVANKDVATTATREAAVNNRLGSLGKTVSPTMGVASSAGMHISSDSFTTSVSVGHHSENIHSSKICDENSDNCNESVFSCVPLDQKDLSAAVCSTVLSVSESNSPPVVFSITPLTAGSPLGGSSGRSASSQVSDDVQRLRCNKKPKTNKTSEALLLFSHAHSPGSVESEQSFSCALPSQNYGNFGNNGTLSLYNTSPVASSERENGKSETASDSFASYRTVRKGADTRYAAAVGVDKKLLGIVTHSSYWKYRKDNTCTVDAESEASRREAMVESIQFLDETTELMASNSNFSEDMLMASLASCSLVVSSSAENVERSNLTLASALKVANVSNLHSKEAAIKSLPTTEFNGKKTWVCPGGYRSLESYVYVRGRGKGNYVCATCGVRCKKPSILRKHLHLHTDLRPHHCTVCEVGFKTKGNLSKHLNSKVHLSRCAGKTAEVGGSIDDTSVGVDGLSSDTDLDGQSYASTSRVPHLVSNFDAERDSGCELQLGSSCEVDSDFVNVSSAELNISKQISDSDGVCDGSEQTRVQTHDHSMLTEYHLKSSDPGEAASCADTSAAGYPTSSLTIAVESKTLGCNSTSELTSVGNVEATQTFTQNASISAYEISTVAAAWPQPKCLKSQPVKQSVVVGLNSVSEQLTLKSLAGHSDEPAPSLSVSVASFGTTAISRGPTPVGDEEMATMCFIGSSIDNDNTKRSASKTMHKLSRLNAIDLTLASVASVSDVIDQSTSEDFANARDARIISPVDVDKPAEILLPPVRTERVKPSTTKRCEIFPVPGRVSAEGVRIGTSFACPVCRKLFSSAPRLTLHQNIHFLERPVRCPVCHSSFASRTSLERHRLVEHPTVSLAQAANDPRPHRCDDCGIAFRILGHLAKHKRSKSHAARIEIMPVGHSENISDVGVDLTVGTRNKDSGAVNCMSCENPSELAVLEESVSGRDSRANSPERTPSSVDSAMSVEPTSSLSAESSATQIEKGGLPDHTCDICGETLADFAAFKKHFTGHYVRRPFVCVDCDAGFTTANLLAEHRKIHSQTHICGVCGNKAEHGSHSPPAPRESSNADGHVADT